MAATEQRDGLRIGATLKRARTGRGMEIRTAEELTKIRTKYLRALEAEDWDVLPSAAYTKGFLRTYATVLDLDAETLLDEYRRRFENRAAGGTINPLREPVLERRVPLSERATRRRPRGAWVALGAMAVGVAVVGVLIVTASGGGGAGRSHHHRGGSQHNAHSRPAGGSPHGHPAGGQPVALKLVTRNAVQACLVRGSDQAVIDAQALDAGATAGPFQPADRYRLDLESGGTVELTLNGHRQVVRASRRASFAITSAGAHQIDFRGPRCP